VVESSDCTISGATPKMLSSPLSVEKPPKHKQTIDEECGKIIARYYIQFATLKTDRKTVFRSTQQTPSAAD
jgi:beta-lactamase class A